MTPSPKWDRTHTHIQLAALELFTHQGYSATTTAQIAAVAEVSQMTLFRHFPTKESLILQDPFDPAIAEAVEKRPAKEAPLRAITAGIQSLLDTFTPDVEERLRTRLRIVAENPELTAAAIHSNDETITAIATALTARGVDKLTATALATAVIAGLTRALIDWSMHINRPLKHTLRGVLQALAGTHA